MAMLSLPIAFRSAIGVFAPVFSRPVWQHAEVLLTGAVLAPGQRTVTAILRIMGRSAAPDFQTYHRVPNRALWSPLTASRLLLRLLVAVFIPSGVVVFGLNDPMPCTRTVSFPQTRRAAIEPAQLLAVGRRLQSGERGTSRHPRCSPL